MDKNLKADLVALRNEVMTNLKNIESVVEKIDVKLQDEETVSCLSRCPEIVDLFDQCKKIRWHPDTDLEQMCQFEKSFTCVSEKMSSIQADRYIGGMTDVLRLASRLDTTMGSMPERTAMEDYWDQVSPGASQRALAFMYHRKLKEGDIKPPAAVDEEEVKAALDRLQKQVKQEPSSASIDDREGDESLDPLEQAPSWAKNADTKSTRQIWAEAAEWDEDSQILFGKMWNRGASSRIAIMEEVMVENERNVEGYKYHPAHVVIKCQEDARTLVALFDAIDQVKARVSEVLTGFDRTTVADIRESAEGKDDQSPHYLENWARWYDWCARLVEELERIAEEIPQGREVVHTCLTFMRVTSKERELEIFSPMAIDATSFLPVPLNMPAGKLEKFRQKASKDYDRDLRNAHAWRNRRLQAEQEKSLINS